MDPKQDPSPETAEAREDIDLEHEMAGLKAGGKKALVVALLVASGLFLLMTVYLVTLRDRAGPAVHKISVRAGGAPRGVPPAQPGSASMTSPTEVPAVTSPNAGAPPSPPPPRVFPTQQAGAVPIDSIPPEWRNDPDIIIVRRAGGMTAVRKSEASPLP